MTSRLSGKTALVTAAAQGIGAAIAAAFAEQGAQVLATDVNADVLEQTTGVAGLETQLLDVTDPAQIGAVIDSAGPFDVLCNCAGFVHHGAILDCEESEWDFSFDLNVKSMYRVTRAVLPGMLSAGGGSIINIASVASSVKGVINRCVYGASKAAVIGLTKSVAADYIGRGVRCNAICPGTVQSPSLDQRIAAFGDPQAARAAFIARQPMGRVGTPGEIAALAVYLAADESAFTTGATLIVDGGMTM